MGTTEWSDITVIYGTMSFDDRDRESVVALGANCLDGCSVQPLLGADEGECRTRSFDIGVATIRIEHRTVADDVVADDDRARARQLHRPVEIIRVVGLIGVDEDQVEGAGIFVNQCGERLERGTDP